MLNVFYKLFMLSVVMLNVVMLSVVALLPPSLTSSSSCFAQPNFTRMVRHTEKVPIHLSLEQVSVYAGQKVLMEVDNNILLIRKGF
jgi:hypothetical protein